jgi:hypothetical protein
MDSASHHTDNALHSNELKEAIEIFKELSYICHSGHTHDIANCLFNNVLKVCSTWLRYRNLINNFLTIGN